MTLTTAHSLSYVDEEYQQITLKYTFSYEHITEAAQISHFCFKLQSGIFTFHFFVVTFICGWLKVRFDSCAAESVQSLTFFFFFILLTYHAKVKISP